MDYNGIQRYLYYSIQLINRNEICKYVGIKAPALAYKNTWLSIKVFKHILLCNKHDVLAEKQYRMHGQTI